MRKGQLTLKALEIITQAAFLPADLIVGSVKLGGKPTIRRALYLADQQLAVREGRERFFDNLRQAEQIIYKLKKDGLLHHQASGVFPLLTQKGLYKLEQLRESDRNYLPPVNKYKTQKDKTLKIIIFDIPEKIKFKREWLREVLFNLNYKIIQKSVWLGTNKLPQEFIVDLENTGLLDHVHIFAIKKHGSISKSGNIRAL